ncbi:unnamed protein product, partial [Candidula unifasciata]
MVVPPVREDTYVGTVIGRCKLVDGDYPNSGHDVPFVEIIAGNEDQKFGVDYKTCDISLLRSLDYETKTSYTLTFRAYNFPNDPNATTKQQTITVVDVNDNSPVWDFTHMDIMVRVTENGKPPRSTTVTVVFRVVDMDDQPPVFSFLYYFA